MKYLNTFKSSKGKLIFEDTNDHSLPLIVHRGDYSVYRRPASVIYLYKNIFINELVKYNKDHFNRLVENKRPEGPYSPSTFLFDRAMENKQRGLELLKNSKKGTNENN